MTLGKRQAAMEPQQQYQEQTIDLCRKEFSSQTIGIIQELKAKGLVMTPYDESALSRGMLCKRPKFPSSAMLGLA
jgi:hypothetical protein